jgi:hypothetical protein
MINKIPLQCKVNRKISLMLMFIDIDSIYCVLLIKEKGGTNTAFIFSLNNNNNPIKIGWI